MAPLTPMAPLPAMAPIAFYPGWESDWANDYATQMQDFSAQQMAMASQRLADASGAFVNIGTWFPSR